MIKDRQNKFHSETNGRYVSKDGTENKNNNRDTTQQEDGTTDAEKEKLRKQYNMDIDKNQKREYNGASFKEKELSEFQSLKSILEDKNLDDIIQISTYTVQNIGKGNQDIILKGILEEIGYTGLPQMVSEEKFNELKQTHIALYRGVTEKAYAEEFCNGEMFVGLGVHGNGVYTSQEENKAKNYARESGAVIEMLLDKRAKVVKMRDIKNEASILRDSLKFDTDIDFGLDAQKLLKMNDSLNTRFMIFIALSKGYDAVEIENKDCIILNRSAVIVKEKR